MSGPTLEDLLPLALDITASLSGTDRSRRLVDAVSRVLPCDAVALLHLVREGDRQALVPVAVRGLRDEVLGRAFPREEHPRLDLICANPEPTRFPANSPLPDPYDGLVLGEDARLAGSVHSCLGCGLRVEGELVGVLTADALAAGAFDTVGDGFLRHLAALAGAALRTNRLIDALQSRADRLGTLARDASRPGAGRSGSELLGGSAPMARLRREVDLVARTGLTALVTGETGTGKELVVRALHRASARADQPLVHLDCAALPESVAESELFGHVRGAFTGADEARTGRFQLADGATLFLDEVGELPLVLQPKLLRALQEGEVQPVGSDRARHVDVRVICATNRDLEAEVAAGRFRADLLHRLDVARIQVPALRERTGDVPLLVGHFADRARISLGTGPVRFTPEALAELVGASWPGNVRELENVVARGVLHASVRVEPGRPVRVEVRDLDLRRSPEGPGGQRLHGPWDDLPLREAVDRFQRERVLSALQGSDGNWAAAARSLGLDRGNLHRLARRLGLLETVRGPAPGPAAGPAPGLRHPTDQKVRGIRRSSHGTGSD